MKTEKKQSFALGLNILIILLEIIGIIVAFFESGLGIFQYYTQDSNIFTCIGSIIFVYYLIIYRRDHTNEVPEWTHILRYVSTCCVTVTFLVVLFVLAPAKGENGYIIMFLKESGLFHHFLCPVLSFISFLFFEDGIKLNKNHARYAVIPTVMYALITIILNSMKLLDGPYFFLKVHDQSVIISILWFVLIVGGAFLIASGIRFLKCKLK